MPDEIDAISCIHPIPCHMIWRLAPQEMVSASKQFKERLTFMSDAQARKMADLPVTGEFHGEISREQMIALAPDVIVSLNKDPRLDKEQEDFGAPVVAASKNTLDDYEASWRFIGQIVGNAEEGDALADYWHRTMAEIAGPLCGLSAQDRPKVYYAQAAVTSTPGSKAIMSSIIRTAGGVGYCEQNPCPAAKQAGESIPVSMEDIVAWNPDVIITATANGRAQILADPRWAEIAAVKNDRVYASLNYERLDGIQSLLGLVWTGLKLHPERIKLDFEKEARAFYSLIYRNDELTAAEINQERN